MSRTFFLLAAVLAESATAGCKSADTGTIQIITDEDAGTFTQSPALTELQVAAESADASTVLATAQLPTTTIDLGQLSESAPAVLLGVTGFDSSKTARVFGSTLPLQYAALAGQTIPIFVQRKGELALLPGPLSDSRQAPVLSVIQGEFLLVAGGSDLSLASTTQLFDFGGFAAYHSPPTLPVAPESIALSGTIAWLINTKGATYFDFASSAYGAVPTPSGGWSFADVAGGETVIDPNGVQYIVGGTRTTGPSATVLKIDPTDASDANYPYGKPSWMKLPTSRRGAGAAWIVGRGLVVAGGNTPSGGPGIEIVDPTFSESSALPFPADESVGLSAAALDGQHVLLAGGITPSFEDPGSRAIDLGCIPSASTAGDASASTTGDASASTSGDASASTTCVTSWGSPPFALESAQTFAWTANDGLVVGSEFATGRTHVFRLSPKSATEIPTRVAHKNARAAWSPVGSIVLFGGAGALESFVP